MPYCLELSCVVMEGFVIKCELVAVLLTGLDKSAVTGELDNKVVDVCDVGTDKHSMSELHDDTGPDVSSLIMGQPKCRYNKTNKPEFVKLTEISVSWYGHHCLLQNVF